MSKTIITIGREFGSGGRTIGKEVAARLGIECYDDKIIDEAAKISGFTTEFIQGIDEKARTSLLYNMVMSTAYGAPFRSNANGAMSLDAQVFFAQQEAILKLARKSCVIVGRCADYVLKDEQNLLRCFVYAPLKDRLNRAVGEYGIDKYNAQKIVQQEDIVPPIKPCQNQAAYFVKGALKKEAILEWFNCKDFKCERTLCSSSSFDCADALLLIYQINLSKNQEK